MKTMRFIGIVLALFSAGSPPAAQAQDSGKKYKVYMVSNSHLDTQWPVGRESHDRRLPI